jgi:uncharacterized membrane protein
MIDCLLFVATVLAVLGCGLIAGAFFAFAAFVMTALGRLPAPSGIAAMQSIIAAIKGPLFLVVFFGTAALAGVLGLAAPLRWSEPGSGYLLLGSLLFLNGPFGVTLMKNLPLNNRLAAVKPKSAEGASFWTEFRATMCGGSARSPPRPLSFGRWSKAAHRRPRMNRHHSHAGTFSSAARRVMALSSFDTNSA